ncbi:MAG: tagaturonate reductase, partial [Ginsengibacter sp.]
YPGKLLAFLFERFKAFNGSNDSGLIIIPTELIPDNGKKLESIVLELAHLNELNKEFIEWLNRCNFFCSSLVDRIVTGSPGEKIKHEIESELGYDDELLTLCEAYCLWAIEGDEHIKKMLSFAVADEGLIISPDIALYRELKLRLLNATHTMSCGVAFFSNINTVKEAMEDKLMSVYIADLMKKEIGPAIPYEINSDTVNAYSENVLDRFRNPHINHIWKNITLNYSSKIKLRCVPVIINFYKLNNTVPELFALGFAAYIYFMKAVKQNEKLFFGESNGEPYLIEDEEAENFYHMWQTLSINEVANNTLKNIDLWGTDLSVLPGFQQSVIDKLNSIINYGMRFTLERIK